jgi:ribose-phosphate pyrophosphokinase
MLVACLSSNSPLARSFKALPSIKWITPNFSSFLSGEYKLFLNDEVKGNPVLIIANLSENFESSLLKLLLLIDTIKNKGAGRIFLFIPYLNYMRQDKITHDCFTISAKVIATILSSSPIDQIITLDIHSSLAASYFAPSLQSISFFDIFKKHLNLLERSAILIAPDQGAQERVSLASQNLDLEFAVLDKQRIENQQCRSRLCSGEVRGKNCVILDDILDSGNTLKAAAKELRDRGASSVKAFITHRMVTSYHLNAHELNLDELIIANDCSAAGESSSLLQEEIADLVWKQIEFKLLATAI